MAIEALKIFRETALPATLQAYSIYMIAPASSSVYVEMYVTNSAAVARRIINKADIDALIATAVANINQVRVVNDITARNALAPTSTVQVLVKNATGDASVVSGAATYIYDTAAAAWVKISEAESMDLVLAWANITGKPTSTPTAIDNAVSLAHSHANKTQLDLISQDATGNILYNANLPHIGWDSTGW